METRKSIGERMLERLDQSDRFGRFSRQTIGFRLGSYLFPQSSGPGVQRDESSLMTHLSSAPYWDRIQRLGSARLRRQQRLAALSERSNRSHRLSAYRRLPRIEQAPAPFFGLSSLSMGDTAVLAPFASTPETLDSAGLSPSEPNASPTAWVGAQRAASPWLTGTFRAARVASPPSARPLERAAERAPIPAVALDRVRRAAPNAESVSTSRTVGAGALQRSEHERTDRSRSQQVGRAIRRSAGPTRMAAVDIEAALPDDFLPPTRHAQGRIASRRSARRGLRSTLSASPLMAALDAMTASEPLASPVARSAAVRAPRVAAGMTATRRVAHRVPDASEALLSASPVTSPATVAPSALTTSALTPSSRTSVPGEGMARESARFDGERAEDAVTARKSVPMVRALARASDPVPSIVERPLSARGPVAVRPVKARSGVFAPETSVLVPGVVPVEATEDAAPDVAQPRSARRTAAANAMQRRLMPAMPPANVPPTSSKGEGRSLGPITPSVRPTVGSIRPRPNRAVRSAAAAFVPEGTVLDTAEGRLQDRLGAVSTTSAATGKTMDARVERAGASIERASGIPARASGIAARTTRTRNLPSAGAEFAELLAPVLVPDAARELPQGRHAAERLSTPPVIARTAQQTLERTPPAAVLEPARAQSPERLKRSLAPKRFRSPLSHIKVRRGAARSAAPAPGTITLQASAEHAVREGADLQTARQAAMGQLTQAWERSGRPLDWSAARIEVVQVAASAAVSGTEPARAQRTVEGAYVPAARVGRPRGPASSVAPATMTRPAVPRASRTMDGVAAVPGVVLDPPQASAPAIDDAPLGPTAGTADQGGGNIDPVSPRRRVGFDQTLDGVGSGRVESAMPIWAQRSTGRPRIANSDDLVNQLARASAPEDVVSVLMDQSDSVRRATSSLPTPVVQVIQQIKTEAVRAEGEAQATQRAAAQSQESVRRRSQRREGVRSTTRVVRGMTGLNPRGSSERSSSSTTDRIGKLAKRLQELIAMAESQNRSGARQEVRMAEDSSAARAEGQSAPTAASDAADTSADIDTLAREVTEQVTRELEMRRERRQEDPDGRSIWW